MRIEDLQETGLSEEEARQLLEWAMSEVPVKGTELNTTSKDVASLEESDLEFLKQSFPNVPELTLKMKLLESGNNLNQAIDIVLNYEATRDAGPQYFDAAQMRQTRAAAKQKKKQDKGESVRSKNIETVAQCTNTNYQEAEAQYLKSNECLSEALKDHYDRRFTGTVNTVLRDYARETQPKQAPQNPPQPVHEELFDEGPVTKGRIEEMRKFYVDIIEAQNAKIRAHKDPSTRVLANDARAEVKHAKEALCVLESLSYREVARKHNQGIVDFHKMNVRTAIEILKDKVRLWDKKGRRESIVFVTGLGRHSAGPARIRPAVKEWLIENRIPFEEKEGSFVI